MANTHPAVPRSSLEEKLHEVAVRGPKKSLEDGSLLRIPLESIGPHPDQPRTVVQEDKLKELAASIQTVGGLLHPIDVRPAVPEEAREGEPACEYRLIAGQRRLEAYRRLHAQATTSEERSRWATIPALLKLGVDEADALEQAVIENIQREELSPLDEAEAYARIRKKRGLKSAKEIAARVGKKEERVRRLLRLNEAPEIVKAALRTGLTVTVRVPADAGNTEPQERRVRERRLDYLEALEFMDLHEHLFEKHGGFKKSSATEKADDGARRAIERALTEGWGLRRIQEHVAATKAGRTPAAIPAPASTTLFRDDGRRFSLDRKQLASGTQEQRETLRAVLVKLLDEIDGGVSSAAGV
jgi:ParB/RepB/Spo0J family partition protein